MTRARRRIAAVTLAASGAVPAVLMAGVGPARADVSVTAGWWTILNLGDPAPPPPVPPDVHDGDLLVQGSNAGPTGTPLGGPPATAQAIAAVGYTLDNGDVVSGPMTLAVDGTAPPQVSVVACKSTETITGDSNGQWSQAPSYDASSCVTGKLQGGNVVFDGVAAFAQNQQLSVVLLPGPLDRVVFKPPASDSLPVSQASSGGSSSPPLGAGLGSGSGAGAGAAGGGSPAVSAAGAPPPTSTGVTAAVPPDAGAAPVVAGSASTTRPALAPTAATSGLSTGARRGLAFAVIALEVLAYLWLTRAGETAAEAAPGVAIAGGRLRPPDRPVTGRHAQPGGLGGVGRFRRPRQGAAPPL